ncbi:HD domain-containing protein [Krasilnikovia sp. MM14-A1259]|uniref:HD domain-containing protein n=1 Tax=Krasilnikovia sp. MM14-A1259 TaxID=3373539 RepID=UPI0037F1339B
MTAPNDSDRLVRDARRLAGLLLADLPERWRHTAGVARRAERLAGTVDPADVGLLVASAWLHDIGYAASLRGFGFHPLDGAQYLRAHGWPSRLVGLVAHHSEALLVARVRGLADHLTCFPHEQSAVSDAVTAADQAVGPDGRPMSIDERLTDMLRRHGSDSPNAMVHPQRAPLLRAAVRRVELRQAGKTVPTIAEFALVRP